MASIYKYLVQGDLPGTFKEVAPIDQPTGGDDHGLMICLDGTGRIDQRFMPIGLAPDTIGASAIEDLAAGDFVYLAAGPGDTLTCGKASAIDSTKLVKGFVLESTATGTPATVYLDGLNTKVSKAGLTAADMGKGVYLSLTGGGCVLVAPSATGNVVQPIGALVGFGAEYAVVAFEPQSAIVKG